MDRIENEKGGDTDGPLPGNDIEDHRQTAVGSHKSKKL
jgi:hypothetical protein